MKITERERKSKALLMIHDMSEYAQSTNPKRDWEEAAETIGAIYRLAHYVLVPKCRKNHPSWGDVLNQSIRATRNRSAGKGWER